MPNGTLKLYNKLTNALLVSLDILSTFNIEDNLNETPSNMKVKVITTDTYREEFQVNTVAFHEDTNSWWVIKSDESTYITTGEYEHEIQLVEYLEFYAYRHLPNCAFAPNTYDLEDMLNRLFGIAKLSISVIYPDFLDKDKIMPFFSFENFTVANVIKNVARAINAIPKMIAGYPFELFTGNITFSNFAPESPSDGDYWYRSVGGATLFERIAGAWVSVEFTSGTTTPINSGFVEINFVNTATQELFITSTTWTPRLTFINRNGLDTQVRDVLNDQFPIAYEKNMNSSDQFTTRSVSNITNAKSSSLVIAPLSGGFKPTNQDTIIFNLLNSRIYLPSRIDSIDFLRIYFEIDISQVVGNSTPMTSTSLNIYRGYYFNKQVLIDALTGFTDANWTAGDITTAIANLPDPLDLFKVLNSGTIDRTNLTDDISFFNKKMIVKSKFDFDSTTDNDTKERTAHWLPFTNELVMPLSFRNGLEGDNSSYLNSTDHNPGYTLVSKTISGQLYRLMIRPRYGTTGVFSNFIPSDKILVQVGYYPIADIKISIDNDNDAQDEKYFNQSGKVIDSVSVSKLITSHTNDSVEGTKIRNARHFTLNEILPLGQLVRDNEQLYIISQRSIDGHVKNGNEYYNVIYTLSRNRIARSENIVADSAVISYKTPDDNLVGRSQLYKDYIELSLVNNNQEEPYMLMSKALVFSDTLAGTDFDCTVLAKNEFGTTPNVVRYVKNPINFDLHKAKLMNVNWQSNNLLGYRLDPLTVIIGSSFAQTPIVYTDNLGKATNFELLFLDKTNLNQAISDYNTPTVLDTSVPFTDLTQVPTSFYTDDVIADGRFSIRIQEPTYAKDPFEIPVFEYMIQGNDDYSANGNIVIGNDLFSTFTGTLRYHYTINNSTRFTAENAIKQYVVPDPTDNRRVIFVRDSETPHIIDLDLFNNLNTSTRNSNLIVNIGIYATDGTTVKFLFAINDYVASGANDRNDIRVYINNWKI
jgi:hypothetical protein